jgi:hypothetical protein
MWHVQSRLAVRRALMVFGIAAGWGCAPASEIFAQTWKSSDGTYQVEADVTVSAASSVPTVNAQTAWFPAAELRSWRARIR